MSPPSKDLALVQAVVRGDSEAFKTFTTRIRPIVGSCLRSVLRRRPELRDDQEDLSQAFDVFLLERDYRVLRTYAGEAAVTTWIHCVASRFFLRQAKRLARRNFAAYDQEAAEAIADDAPNPEAHSLSQNQIEGVRAVISELSNADQVMMRLIYEQEVPAHVVGRILGLSGAGVRMRKKRLLARLADQLKEFWL